MTGRYDLVLGLGSACLCTETLREAGLQFASFPFDWVSGGSLRSRTELLVGDFVGWLEPEDLEFVGNPAAFGHDTYFNRKTTLTHPHDFAIGRPLTETYGEVRAKYERRIGRLMSLLSYATRVLVVWIADPRDSSPVSDEDAAACLKLLGSRFPSISFELTLVDCSRGRAFPDLTCISCGRVTRVAFDYRSRRLGAKPWDVEVGELAQLFTACRATDYRTHAEKQAQKRRHTAREMERFGVTSHFGLFWARLSYKFRRSMEKRFHRYGTYDAVISLGQWCAAAMLMEKCGLRSCSGPFDWFGVDRSVADYVQAILSDCKDLFRKENLRVEGLVPGTRHIECNDSLTGFGSRHDFDADIPFDESYARFRGKIDRRAARLKELLQTNIRILFVHYRGEGHYASEELTSSLSRLREFFPRPEIELLVLETEMFAPGLTYDTLGPGITRAVGDFYDRSRYDAVIGNEKLALKVLRRISVRGQFGNLLRLRLKSISKRLRKWGLSR